MLVPVGTVHIQTVTQAKAGGLEMERRCGVSGGFQALPAVLIREGRTWESEEEVCWWKAEVTEQSPRVQATSGRGGDQGTILSLPLEPTFICCFGLKQGLCGPGWA